MIEYSDVLFIQRNSFLHSPAPQLVTYFITFACCLLKKTRDSHSVEKVMSTLQLSCAIHEKSDEKRERKNRSPYKFSCFLFDEIEQQKTSTRILEVSYFSAFFFTFI
jgi:hypothetical protein